VIYAFISNPGTSWETMRERVEMQIKQDGLNLHKFAFREYTYIPSHLLDSFSRGFLRQRVRVLEAQPE